MTPPIRAVIADDQMMVRQGFTVLLNAEPDIEVVGQAVNGLDAVAKVDELTPDVVLMDIRMPELGGIEATRRITAREGSEVKVLVLTTFDLDEYVFAALRAGASGFLLKTATADELTSAIRSVAAGGSVLAPRSARALITEFVRSAPPRATPPGLDELTDREREVLTLLGTGLSNADLATALGVSAPTVKSHVSRVLSKLQLTSRVQAAIVARELER